jgi:hypothetical protein
MRIETIVEQCLYETGIRQVSGHAREVALLALLLAPDGPVPMREYRGKIKETYLKNYPEMGSFFVLFILPMLVSLISSWVVRWILNRRDLGAVRSQAYDALTGSAPMWTATLTSISTPQKTPPEPVEW